MRFKLVLFLIWNFSYRTCWGQDTWIDPFFVLTQEAKDLGVAFVKPGEVRFTVTAPEKPQIGANFTLGTFSISGGESTTEQQFSN